MLRNRSARLFCLILLFGCAAAMPLYATIFGVVQGIIHDPQHRPVQGAQVTVRALSADWQQEATTDADGAFHLNNVPIGQYDIRIFMPGFAPEELQTSVLSNSAPTLHFALKIAAV